MRRGSCKCAKRYSTGQLHQADNQWVGPASERARCSCENVAGAIREAARRTPIGSAVYPRAWGAKTVRSEHQVDATPPSDSSAIFCSSTQTHALLGVEVLNLLALLQRALVATKTRLGELVGPLLCASASRLSRKKEARIVASQVYADKRSTTMRALPTLMISRMRFS